MVKNIRYSRMNTLLVVGISVTVTAIAIPVFIYYSVSSAWNSAVWIPGENNITHYIGTTTKKPLT